MSRLRSLIGQSPAIAIASVALVLSVAGGATAATVSSGATAKSVTWHPLSLINGWRYGGFSSFHAAYYVDASKIVHLRGSARLGNPAKAVFRLPVSARPSHVISELIYASGGTPAAVAILPDGKVTVFDQTGTNSAVTDFTSFDGVTFPLG
jgi:hypothetical protein